ncbi:Mov34/MPN/PAD-1 family protein [Anaerospora hongkongensis]|uniref:Mov34/MPN/PAD-1 family protein n=1 Tax=Anaerospora hongkongensis TaxID=244830 RepID=UPI00289FDF35|nr:Mov34/MPN/PAD-1 family protein [Anaerospora hongkongensis]
MEIESRCYKLKLPNGRVVDILSELIDEMSKWLQHDIHASESGGYILGYQHRKTGNITLEFITIPQEQDICSRIRCTIKDFFHRKLLRKAQLNDSYYMGVWHTHPQQIPTPSNIDYRDWQESLRCERTGGDYIFFLIAGTQGFRVWVGDYSNHKIVELNESQKKGSLYMKNSHY